MIRVITLIILLVLATLSYAQPVVPPPTGPPGGGGAPVPITGIEWLIGGGLLLGSRLMSKLKRKKEQLH